MKILALSGSIRTGSWNSKVLSVAVAELRSRSEAISVDVFDLRAANIPIYDPDTTDQNPSPGLKDFKARVKASDALLIASPEYNYGIPGVLKNLIDSGSRPPAEALFKGKVIGQLGATTGMGGTIQSQLMIRHIFTTALNSYVVPGMAFTVSKAPEAFTDDGQFKDERHKRDLAAYLTRFIAEIETHTKRAT